MKITKAEASDVRSMRIPISLINKLMIAARNNHRTMAGEIIIRLKKSFEN